ncbi:MAG: carboxypeptidase-like regulatory domain-containing protein [Acidobacteriaceae bacterium]
MRRGTQFFWRGFCVPIRRRWIAVGCLALLGVLGGWPPLVQGQDFGLRNLQGKVLDGKDAPINGAIVYLQNSRNNDIKTFLSGDDGSYRFAALSDDTDYTLWAAYKGKKSPTKTISSFDTRKLVVVDLHIK